MPVTIAITGAGPVGLTLARLLLPLTSYSTNEPLITLTIFEKDVSSTSRTSIGGTLDLHTNTGLAAIKAMDIWDSFSTHARYEGEEMRMCDLNGMVYVHQVDPPPIDGIEARPEIDRVRLMDVLLASVPSDLIQWGKTVKGATESSSEVGKWNLHFEDGTTPGPFDLIVGADGAWSKVRKCLTEIQPSYSGICGITGSINELSCSSSEIWTKISNAIGKGSNFNYSYGRSILGQRLGDGTLKCAFYQRRDKAWVEDIKSLYGSDDDALKRILLDEYKDWIPEYHTWIEASEKLWCHSLWELPVGNTFEHKRGITIIGDAAHLMTPFAGEGVNAGMKDALDLATAIKSTIAENSDLDGAVAAFEQSMFIRSKEFMADTLTNKNGMFADDSPYTFFVDMIEVVFRQLGRPLNKGWLSLLRMPIRGLGYSVFWCMGTYGAVRRRVRDALRRPA